MTRSLMQLLGTARDGLAAQAFGMGVTGQNVSNVNTPGYARRIAQLETRGQGLMGVNIAGVQRVADAVLERRTYQTASLSSAASERDSQLGGIEALFDDAGGTGLADSLGALFASFSGLASNPSDPTTRANVLSRAEAFAGRVQETADAIATTKDNLFNKAKDAAADLNQRAQTVARLNQEIAAAKARGDDTSDLEDQRNQALLGLASLIDIRTLNDDSGAVLVQAAGTTLVEGSNARQISIDLASGGALRVLASTASGSTTDVTQFLTGGKLAGIREARDQDAASLATRLDTFAYEVATTINAQHAAGFGLDGVGGRALFDIAATPVNAARTLTLSADVAGQPDAIAASGSATTLPGGSDNAVLLSELADAAMVGGRTAADAYGDIVGDIGQRKASAAQEVTLRGAIADQVKAMRESTSGVSLDEEMVSLTKFQRAYEASAKVLSVVDQLLEELLARIGR